jgi:CRP-like cAMP-binding protein
MEECTMAQTVTPLEVSALDNQLLASLPDAARQRWLPQLELVNLSVGQVLCDAGISPCHAYFPSTAIVSLVCAMQDGASTETAVIGRDGMVGMSLVMGSDTSTFSAVVNSAGLAYRLRPRALKHGISMGGDVLRPFLRYTLAMIAQMAQTAVCNRHHSIEQQVCRRLLLALDRSSSNELLLTQELVASLLGVRREGVTEAAVRLQKLGVIRYSRGHITVVDRRGLEMRTCECYASASNEADRLSPARTLLPDAHCLALVQ